MVDEGCPAGGGSGIVQAAVRASQPAVVSPNVLARALGSVQLSREVEGELTSLGHTVRLSDIEYLCDQAGQPLRREARRDLAVRQRLGGIPT